LLFDIDGTLIRSGGTGRRALARAFDVEHGRKDACTFRFDGMTDLAIVRGGLEAIGVPATQAGMDQVLARYLSFLEDEVARADPASYLVHAGMRAAVDEGLSRKNVAVGLGTGNVAEGARIKLARVDLHRCFRFGGYGSDHEDRPTLIRTGAERGAKELGVPLEECRVVVIGDTPKDVSAAQAIGAECLAVATGAFDLAALLQAGATYAFPNLSAPGALEALFP
jgi:phosphoglycolate phosphatase-like HAD superfamily hydrolase